MPRNVNCYCVSDGVPNPKCLGCDGTGYDTQSTDEPICPWCGEEMSTDDLHQSTTRRCCHCNNDVEVEVERSVSYTTAKPNK